MAMQGSARTAGAAMRGKRGAGRSLRLDDQLCFTLYTASRLVTAFYRPLLDELGLTYPQYLVLLVLWERGPCQLKDVAAALDLDYGTLSPLLKRLEAAGLVRRERRSDDERAVSLTLSPAGESLRASCASLPAQVAQAMGLSPKGLTQLKTAVQGLAASIAATSRGRGKTPARSLNDR